MRTTYALRTMVAGALLLTGCAKDGEDTGATTKTTKTGADEDSNSDTGTGAVLTDSGPEPTTGDDPPVLTGNDETTASVETTGNFIVTPDGGGAVNECDIWKQDCPAGQKCMPWAADGGSSWNATKCSPLNGSPAQIGDECVAEGGGVAGVDNCDIGSMCWFLDPENKGSCVEMCQGTADAPTCSAGKVCDESNDGVIIVCLETCDPLAQSCPENQICFFDGIDTFICDFDASGEEGQYGDPCAYINVCDYGLFCASAESVPGCPPGDGCCSPYCNLSEPNTCPGAPDQECVAWYAEGESVPPGQENVGACAIPN
jgi:hypothetical protein